MRKTVTRTLPLVLLALAFALSASAADVAKAAASSPQGKAYLVLQKAIAAGDYQAVRNSMSQATLAKMDEQNKEMNLDPKEMMELLKAMAPTDLKFTGLKVEGKTATLDATGQMAGELNWGTISLAEEGGQWKINSESWTNTKK